MKRLITFTFLFYCSLTHCQVSKIIVWNSLYDDPSPILMNYLQRALEVSKAEYGDYELIESAKMEQGRSLIEIAKPTHSKLDVASYAPTAEREQQAIAIRIPLLSGMMGYRLCLIKKKQQYLFNGISNKQQLINKHISIGLHQDWPDTQILRANNIAVQTSHKKELLFKQLIRGRFDCFSRGANEIYGEYLNHREQGISIENELLIHYPLPVFFFVNKARPLLAARLQFGLQKLIDSGEFARIFEDFFAPLIYKLKLTDRRVIDLKNPTLSETTLQAIKIPTQKFRRHYLTN